MTVAGGRYTTYRVMAKDAVVAAVRGLPGSVEESRTHEVPLAGSAAIRSRWRLRVQRRCAT